MTALVGPSGAGKSALVGLLERFYEPQRGRILLDGRDLRDYEHQYLHRQVRASTFLYPDLPLGPVSRMLIPRTWIDRTDNLVGIGPLGCYKGRVSKSLYS